jgi:hypothetical protein
MSGPDNLLQEWSQGGKRTSNDAHSQFDSGPDGNVNSGPWTLLARGNYMRQNLNIQKKSSPKARLRT